jgi:hypothetical protein
VLWLVHHHDFDNNHDQCRGHRQRDFAKAA